ncbi:uncharacterized protein CC84DRAFT_1242080 [Paraphaeosphaeria sporulosa]|uniref:DUF7587 domain-containing protein n=1 Tax=Paraphaeosphaeria sporulosa TaxID=1460663 RepID=A0A177CJ99_9PLEO|nr:uncharacterized protein CC84DRAFT_1242080 [Paraphaeosphaeria sporulosa]OAG07052.1 hypothetical protein CC84DRAFT_1242080 [Paraphaeosphaeria sporulosa]
MSTLSSPRAAQYHQPTTHPQSTPSDPSVHPSSIPPFVYRVHRARSQTAYDFSTGFRAKNQTTIINQLSHLSRFGLAHLNQQTNISSPFISVYRSQVHAEEVARYFARLYDEDTWVVTIDTNHLSRGPVFWAGNLLEGQEMTASQTWLHEGEYLCLYRISPQAIRDQTRVVRKEARSYGVIGGRC